MSRMNVPWFERLLLGIPRAVVGSIIFSAVLINVANVIGRYVFRAPIDWAEHVMIFMLIWGVYVGAVLVSWDGSHLKMNIISTLLPRRAQWHINLITAVFLLAICVFMVTQSFRVVEMMALNDQRSVTASIPMVIPHSALLIGFFLMLIAVAARLRFYLTGTGGSEVKDIIETYGEPEGASDPNEPNTA